jgi:hypothetical protein
MNQLFSLLIVFAATSLPTLRAQTPEMVKDIASGSRSSIIKRK